MSSGRFERAMESLANELMEWWEWLDSLPPEQRAVELAAIEAAGSPYDGGPCVQAPAIQVESWAKSGDFDRDRKRGNK